MLTDEQLEQFREDGFLVINDFLQEDEVQLARDACRRLVDAMNPEEHATVFKTGDKQVGDQYFLTSGDKIRYFFEEKSFNDKGEMVVDKHTSLNKIGHALHWLMPEFRRLTFSDKIKNSAKSLGFINPAVAQSMYIFKHPGVAGEVIPHQDATYLHTEPINVVGYWIALEDATIDNGCLWFIPGSHKGSLARRMIRTQDPSGPFLKHTAPDPQYDIKNFSPLPVSKGALVLIHGLVVHKSEGNTTNSSREIYTFHLIETVGTKYSTDNWLQPSKELPFPLLYNINE